MSPEEALVCAFAMVANGVLVAVPVLLSLPVGEIYHVAAFEASVTNTSVAAKTLQNKYGFNAAILLAVFGFKDAVVSGQGT
jgi:hypothetical protein